jgi:hypothetical protein
MDECSLDILEGNVEFINVLIPWTFPQIQKKVLEKGTLSFAVFFFLRSNEIENTCQMT